MHLNNLIILIFICKFLLENTDFELKLYVEFPLQLQNGHKHFLYRVRWKKVMVQTFYGQLLLKKKNLND